MSYEAMEYQGFEYLPDVLEDEDTRRYIHTVYQAGVLVGQIDKTHWYPAKFEEFKQFVEQYLLENA